MFLRYRLIRDEIVHEDGLIGQRLGWFLTSQAFLLAALATANGGQRTMPAWSTNEMNQAPPRLCGRFFVCPTTNRRQENLQHARQNV